jgi:hypothetical protein
VLLTAKGDTGVKAGKSIIPELLIQRAVFFQVFDNFPIKGTFFNHIVIVPEFFVVRWILVMQAISLHFLVRVNSFLCMGKYIVDKQ